MPATSKDQAIAYKAIALCHDLKKSEKEVCAALVDHYNRKTGRCDPSIGRLHKLTGNDRRTVIRAIERLEELGLIDRYVHGGIAHRNFYVLEWKAFKKLGDEWDARFRGHSRATVTPTPPSQRQASHHDSGENVTQTHLKNPIEITQDIDVPESPDKSSNDQRSNGHGIRSESQPQSYNSDHGARRRRRNYDQPQRIGDILSDILPTVFNVDECEHGKDQFQDLQKPEKRSYSSEPRQKRRRIVPTTNRSTAWRDLAERRWKNDVREVFGADKEGYMRFLLLIDDEMHQTATDAECNRWGGGLEYLLAQTRKRQPPSR